jgi:hypothetical protein
VDDRIIGVIRPGIKFNQNFGNPGDFYVQADAPVAYKRLGQEKDHTFAGLDVTLGWLSSFGLSIKATGHILFTPNDKSLFPDGVAAPPSSMMMILTEVGPPYAGYGEEQIRAAGMWKPSSDDLPDTNGFTGISVTVSYETGPIYAEVALTTPVKKYGGYGLLHNWFDTTPDYGMVITPMFQYTVIPGLSAYANLTIDGIFTRAEKGRKVDIGLTPAIGVTYSF